MTLRELLAAASLMLCAGCGAFAETFTAKPVTLVVPLGAGGALSYASTGTGAVPHLATELLKSALGTSSLTRIGIMPDVQALAEAGVPGFEAVSWHIVVAPAATPPDVVEKLHAAFKAVGKQPEIQEKLVGMGLIPVDTPSLGDLKKLLATEMGKWRQQVEKAGIAGSM